MAAVLNRQKPIGAHGLGVMAGRAHGDEGVVAPCRPSPRSTASVAPPTARSAASKVPGDMVVSASMRTMPSFGAASRTSVTKSSGWHSATVSISAIGASARTSAWKVLGLQRLLDRAQPVRPLRMAGRRQMVEPGGWVTRSVGMAM